MVRYMCCKSINMSSLSSCVVLFSIVNTQILSAILACNCLDSSMFYYRLTITACCFKFFISCISFFSILIIECSFAFPMACITVSSYISKPCLFSYKPACLTLSVSSSMYGLSKSRVSSSCLVRYFKSRERLSSMSYWLKR